MTIIAFLPVFVFAAGLVLYFICAGLTKATVGEVGRIMFAIGLLAFLIGAGAQSCSMGTANGSAGSLHSK